MRDDADVLRIAEAESEDTFESITDLNSLCDTTVLATTFLLSAQVTLAAVVLNSEYLSTGVPKYLFIIFAIVSILSLALSIDSIIRSLLPIAYYTGSVGEFMLDNPWVPFRGNASSQFSSVSELDTLDERDPADGHSKYREEVERFLDRYGSVEEVRTHEEYLLARLYHYKQVGFHKAKFTGLGLAWLRWAVVSFILQFVILIGSIVL